MKKDNGGRTILRKKRKNIGNKRKVLQGALQATRGQCYREPPGSLLSVDINWTLEWSAASSPTPPSPLQHLLLLPAADWVVVAPTAAVNISWPGTVQTTVVLCFVCLCVDAGGVAAAKSTTGRETNQPLGRGQLHQGGGASLPGKLGPGPGPDRSPRPTPGPDTGPGLSSSPGLGSGYGLGSGSSSSSGPGPDTGPGPGLSSSPGPGLGPSPTEGPVETNWIDARLSHGQSKPRRGRGFF